MKVLSIAKKTIGGMLLAAIPVTLAALIMGLPLMLFWDWLMPTIFGLEEITFFQANGLYFMSGILFKTSIVNTKD